MSLEHSHFICLAEDDEDDRLLFQEALNEIAIQTQLVTVSDGEQLMEQLEEPKLPDVLFLDLNMPRKDGFQCLQEIKKNKKLRELPVIIFSTSFQPETVNSLYENGAQYYIRKPSNFGHFKELLSSALILVGDTLQRKDFRQPPKEKFVLRPGPG